jgi:hypothetical protein
LFLEFLAISLEFLMHKHQVDFKAFLMPIGMRLYQLLHHTDIGGIAYREQHDRQVTRYGVSPQTRLSPMVGDDGSGIGTEQGIGVEDRTGDLLIEEGGFRCAVYLLEGNLAVGLG